MSETITRVCGHAAAFTPRGDGYDAARRERIRAKRCPDCGRAKNEADNAVQKAAGSGRIKKGSEIKSLPVGTEVRLVLGADGAWAGTLTAEMVEVDVRTTGAMGVLSKLARKWLSARGVKLTGAVKG